MAELPQTRLQRAEALLRAELESCEGTESNSYLLAWAKSQGISAATLRTALVGLHCRCFWSDRTATELPKKFWSLPTLC